MIFHKDPKCENISMYILPGGWLLMYIQANEDNMTIGQQSPISEAVLLSAALMASKEMTLRTVMDRMW